MEIKSIYHVFSLAIYESLVRVLPLINVVCTSIYSRTLLGLSAVVIT